MKIRSVIILSAVITLFTSPLFTQTASHGDVQGIPKIECSMRASADSLFFRGNDYVPNRIVVTLTLTNTSVDTAKNVIACMVQDTRFIIDAKPCTDTIPFILPGQSMDVTFDMNVASERATDGIDVIRAVAISTNGASATCSKDIWVEHEYFPTFLPACTPLFGQIVFDDSKNDYEPNPFKVRVSIQNVRDGASDSTFVQFLGTRGISIDTIGASTLPIGTLGASETKIVEFDLRAVKRINDTTVTACFQVVGKGGYKRKTYVDSCCVDIFIPRAKQAEYNIVCNIVPDTIGFINHKYEPDPFVFTAQVTNIGTAIGKNVQAQIILPPSIQLDPGETITKPFSDVNPSEGFTVQWLIKPTIRFQRDTVKVCVRVFDDFENSAICCDSVIIDSIRSARFDVACSVPDSVRIDSVKGVYVPTQFPVTFRVCNVGSDYADSVKATIVIQTPDVIGVDPFFPIKRKVDYSAPATDTLEVKSCYEFTWLLEALPRAVSGNITIKFKAEALNAPTIESECRVYIPKLDAPDIDLWCETSPPDSLRFDPATGKYRPPIIIYTIKVINPGGGLARNTVATLGLPPGMLLAPGEILSKPLFPTDIGPKDTGVATWILEPLERRDLGVMMDLKVDVTSETVAGRFSKTCSVFVPALPRTAALILPQDPVGYFGQTIGVPIEIDDPEGKDIREFDFFISINVDNLWNQLPEKVIRVNTAQSVVRSGTLIDGPNWTADMVEINDNLVRVRASGTTSIAYPPPPQKVPPLMYLSFIAEYGNRPNELRVARTELLWPQPDDVERLVLINKGSIFPLVTHGTLVVAGDCLRPLDATDKYVISQNIPNPFNPVTRIEYAIPEEAYVRISVFDAFGRTVRVLVDGIQKAGSSFVTFDASSVPSGVYFYRMDTPKFSRVMKMVVSK